MTGNRRSLKWYKMTEIMRGFCRVEYGKSCLGKHTIITTGQDYCQRLKRGLSFLENDKENWRK